MEMVSFSSPPKTIFFGGGTPSILPIREWEIILEKMHSLGWTHAKEWTVECNPATVSVDKARLLKNAGVNRISMGVQSLDERLLDRLGRIHSREQVFRSYDILRGEGFSNINLDLMFAIPTQSLNQWENTLNEICSMQPEHMSCYEVIYEEDTPLFEQLKAGRIDVDEELADSMYQLWIQSCLGAGYKQYEIANFAKYSASETSSTSTRDLFECQHNLNYWTGGDFVGLGPSATEYVNGSRSKHCSQIESYCTAVENGARGFDFAERLPTLERAGETAAFNIRMNDGIDFALFEERTGVVPLDLWSQEMESLVDRGLAVLTRERFFSDRAWLETGRCRGCGVHFKLVNDLARILLHYVILGSRPLSFVTLSPSSVS